VGLYDVEPNKSIPTWRNKMMGEDIIYKRMHMFLFL
jgi:hypothetical protein